MTKLSKRISISEAARISNLFGEWRKKIREERGDDLTNLTCFFLMIYDADLPEGFPANIAVWFDEIDGTRHIFIRNLAGLAKYL